MKGNILHRSVFAIAISAVGGLALAQQPALTPPERGAADADKSSGGIIQKQTQPPRDAGKESMTSPAERKGGAGSEASKKDSAEIIDKQTHPAAGTGTPPAGSSGAKPMEGDASTKTSGGIISRQTKPGSPAPGGPAVDTGTGRSDKESTR